MRLSGTKSAAIHQYRGLGNQLWDLAGNRPSLDLPFADSKSLVDATTGAQLVTFTRASSGTYVDSEGVIRTATTNLLLRSEEFDDAVWTKVRGSVTSNALAAPNGTLTADLFTADGTLLYHVIGLYGVTSGTATRSYSVYAKAGTGSIIQLNVTSTSDAFVNFDLANQTYGTVTIGAAVTNPSIAPVGNGWYRCSFTATGNADGFEFGPTAALTDTRRQSNSISSTVYFWGAQLEQSSTVGEYIPTGATINSAPRFDHNPVTGESLGLLIEESRTNSIRNNTMVGAVAGTPGTLPTNWQKAENAGLVFSVVGIGSEAGINYIDVRLAGTATATTTSSIQFEQNTSISAGPGQTWTFSSYVTIVGGWTSGLSLIRAGWEERSTTFLATQLGIVSPSTSGILAASKFIFSGTNGNASTTAIKPSIIFTPISGAAIDITLRIGMPQLEQGAFATSVIPTTGTAATRSADVASISDGPSGSNFSGWYRQDEGTMFSKAIVGNVSNSPVIADINDGSTANRISMGSNTGRNGQMFFATATVSQGATNTANTLALGESFALALSYKTDDCALCLSGGSVALDSTVTLPSVSVITLGFRQTANQFVNGHLSRLTFWPRRLANNVLQTITQ